MPSRLVRTLAFRSAAFHRSLVRLLPASPVTKPVAQDLHLVTMSGRNHALFCEQMLLTLGATWSELPVVHILPDKHSTTADLERIRRVYRGPINLLNWEDICRHHAERGRTELIKFAEADQFGRKLALTLASADLRRSLWVDNDILFFGDLVPIIRAVSESKPYLGAARDATFGRTTPYFSYAPLMAREFFDPLPNVPPINAGINLSQGPIYEALRLFEPVRFALDSGEHHYVTEQTIVAIAAMRSRGILWDEPTVHMDDDDIYTLGPTYPGKVWRARHYTGNVRHLFWRDAMFLALARLRRRLTGVQVSTS